MNPKFDYDICIYAKNTFFLISLLYFRFLNNFLLNVYLINVVVYLKQNIIYNNIILFKE